MCQLNRYKFHTRSKKLTEWQIPAMLFPEAVTTQGTPLPVSLGAITRHPLFLTTTTGGYPAALVTIFPEANRVCVHTIAAGSPAGDVVGAVRVTTKGEVWYAGRKDLASGGLVIGRMKPGSQTFEYWNPPIGFGHTTALAIEGDGRAIWTTCLVGLGDFRHALARLDPKLNEVRYWALPDADPTLNESALINARMRGPVAVTPMQGATRSVWWLMTSPRAGDGSRLIRLNPVTGDAMDYGPRTNYPPDLGKPLALTLDAERRPWLTFSRGQVGSVNNRHCGEPLLLPSRTLKVKPQLDDVKVQQIVVQPKVSPVSPTSYVPGVAGNGCFKTVELSTGTYPFGLVGAGVPLADRASGLFGSNGVDRILQIRP
jgi:hypothetical protein